MVDSMVMVVLKSTAGWLLNKGKDRAMKKLRHGDVLDQKLCKLIASDLDTVKVELEALKRTNLVASIRLFNEGIKSIIVDASEVDGRASKRRKIGDGSLSVAADVATLVRDNAILSPDTRERFKEARQAAGFALSNLALSTKDSILATHIEVMAQLLETENATRALMFCIGYLEEMHSRKDVAENFHTELRALANWSPKKSREGRDIIWSACHVNRVVFDMAQLVGTDITFKELFIWPVIEIGSKLKENIDPLRDPRLETVLSKEHRDYSSVVWSFGSEDRHKLKFPSGIATNAQGQFIVVGNSKTKLFDDSGKYLTPVRIVTATNIQCHAVDVDIDQDDNVYLLVQMVDEQNKESWYGVYVFDQKIKLHHSFRLRDKYKGFKLAVNQHHFKTEVLVLKKESGDLHAKVEVYETNDGTFDCQFGGSVLMDAQDLVCAGNGHVFVLDKCHCGSAKKYLREFGAKRYQLRRFEVAPDSVAVAFHRASDHIVIASRKKTRKLLLSIYNTEGIVQYTFELNESGIVSNLSITVTTKGRIVVALTQHQFGDESDPYQGKVIIY